MDKVIKDAPFNGRTPEQYWTDLAKEKLLNRKIVALRYMSEKESEEKYGWYSRTIILTLDDGRQLTGCHSIIQPSPLSMFSNSTSILPTKSS